MLKVQPFTATHYSAYHAMSTATQEAEAWFNSLERATLVSVHTTHIAIQAPDPRGGMMTQYGVVIVAHVPDSIVVSQD